MKHDDAPSTDVPSQRRLPEGLAGVAMLQDDAAEFLQVSTRTIHRLRDEGEIAWYFLGGKVVIPRSELLDYLARLEDKAKKDAVRRARRRRGARVA